ncbi:exopolysaccharide transport family protein [Roseibium litorale]|uniref:Succinoglycan transporter n=1 Tax=Roseibium litorale TaxID=2803841 RepID=A0ABR9CPW1_9HYPH|nr:exopolysaccharide transport family protein [Roseibium litorale]MBD8892876.1 succinoglycan transporter [Roseibium litorale]
MTANRGPAPIDDMALDLTGLLRELRGAMRWLLPLVLLVGALAFISLQFVPSKYKGEARLLIESKESTFPGSSRGVEEERALLDNEGVASQVQLLMSGDLARRVAKKLDLASIPEFKASGSGSLLSSALVMLGVMPDQSRNSVEERVLKVYFKNLDVYRLEGSRVIAVEYSSEDPELAAQVANTILDEYIILQSSAKRKTNEVATTALEPQIEALRQDVQAARKAVEDFRAHADLLMGNDNLTLNQQQLSEISTEYSRAQANKAEAEAKAQLIRELLRSGGALESASDVLNSPLIQRLREREAQVQSNIAELSITLLPNHPQLKALQSQLADYKRLIRDEARKVLVGLESDAKVSSQQAAALKNRLDELKAAAARSNADQVRLSELEREANSKARQLDQMISSFRDADTRLKAQVLPADARIISRASVPIEPYAPKILVITIIAIVVTFVLGCAFIIMRAFLSGAVLYPVEDTRSEEARSEPEMPVQMPRMAPSPYGYDLRSGVSMSASYDYRDAPAGKVDELDEELTDELDDHIDQADLPPVGEEPRAAAVEEEEPGEEDIDDGEAAEAVVAPVLEAPRVARPLTRNLERSVRRRQIAADAQERAAAAAGAEALSDDLARQIQEAPEGRIVVLSIDEPERSQKRAFELARRSADQGRTTLLMEVFPDQEEADAAPGFSDIVAGTAQFSKVIYRDAGSNAHIIETGTVRITDEMAANSRFEQTLDVIAETYDTVVIDLGPIDGSQASANILRDADAVLLMSADLDHMAELKSAARLLSHNTGARVLIQPEYRGRLRRRPGPKGDGGQAA